MRTRLRKDESTTHPQPQAQPKDVLAGSFRAFLHGGSRRATGVREAVLRAALARKGHFHPDDLLTDLRRKGIPVSRATVYRSMPLLLEAGIVDQAGARDGRTLYEAAAGKGHHDHLICTGCGKTVEFFSEALEALQRDLVKLHGFILEGHRHELFGLCPSCQARRSKPERNLPKTQSQ